MPRARAIVSRDSQILVQTLAIIWLFGYARAANGLLLYHDDFSVHIKYMCTFNETHKYSVLYEPVWVVVKHEWCEYVFVNLWRLNRAVMYTVRKLTRSSSSERTHYTWISYYTTVSCYCILLEGVGAYPFCTLLVSYGHLWCSVYVCDF